MIFTIFGGKRAGRFGWVAGLLVEHVMLVILLSGKKMTTLQCQFFCHPRGLFRIGSDPGVVQTEVTPVHFVSPLMMVRPSPSSSSVSRPC